MVKGMPTLNELSQLKQSGFGQPWPPRHGLNLLYWFAHEYIDISNEQIVFKYRPQNGDFGFHKFENRIEDEEDDPLLPRQNLPYYEVGNLNYPRAEELPDYVRANYSRNIPDSNKDRVIVRLDANGSLNRVYVTEHIDSKRFDSNKTFRVSQGLLKIIRNNKSPDQYLSQLSSTRDVQGGFRQTPGEQAGFRQTPGEQAGFRQTPGEQAGSRQTPGEQAGSRQTPGEQAGSRQTPGEQAGSRQTPGEQAGSRQTPGEQANTGNNVQEDCRIEIMGLENKSPCWCAIL